MAAVSSQMCAVVGVMFLRTHHRARFDCVEGRKLLCRVDASTKAEYKERRLGQKNLFAFSNLRAVHSSPLDRTTMKSSSLHHLAFGILPRTLRLGAGGIVAVSFAPCTFAIASAARRLRSAASV